MVYGIGRCICCPYCDNGTVDHCNSPTCDVTICTVCGVSFAPAGTKYVTSPRPNKRAK